ncbi:hypothetical protein [Acinetobacter higginsii]|uniref:hypothetical protein n=1 Tax=Acinetobacter higginsii TaxID=70347 RepID=UPI00300B50D0
MGHKSIQSQTTQPCCTEPKPSDYQPPFWFHVWVNLVDVFKAFLFLGTGLVLWAILTFFFHNLFFGGN